MLDMLERRRDADPHPRIHVAERRFAIDGDAWCVWEDARSHSLIFETDKVARRVREYRPTWRELSDEELFALELVALKRAAR